MATSKEYAEWIVANQSKKNSENPQDRKEFETVVEAYQRSRQTQETNPPEVAPSPSPVKQEDVQVAPGAFEKAIPFTESYLGAEMPYSPESQRQIPVYTARYVAPIAGGVALPVAGAGVAATMLGGAAINALSELAAINLTSGRDRLKAFEDRKQEIAKSGKAYGLSDDQIANELNKLDQAAYETGEVAKAGMLGFVPGFKPSAISNMPRAVVAFLNVGKPVAAMVGAAASGETLRRSLEKGEFNTYRSLGEAARDVSLPAILGFSFGSLTEGLRFAQQRQERINFFKEMGINPVLDMIIPSQAKLGAAVRAFDPQARRELIQSEGPLLETFQKLFPEAVQSEDVRSALVPYLKKIDDQRLRVRAAQKASEEAQLAYSDAASKVETSPEIIQRLRREVRARKLNEVNARAQEILDTQAAFGAVETNTAAREKVSGLVSDMNDLRRMRADELFNAAGIPQEEGLFTVGQLVKSVESSLSSRKSTDAAKRIISTVKALSGEQGDLTPVTLNQVRELRSRFAEEFASITDPVGMNMAASMSSDAYAALLGTTESVIAKKFKDRLPIYKQAVKYWSDTSSAMSSPYSRALLKGDPADSAFANLADNIANGNVSQVQGLERYLQSITDDAPEVAEIARRQFDDALRNSVLQKARGEFGRIDTRKLVSTLSRFPSEVPVENLGFGSKSFIQDWANLFKTYNVNNLTPAEFDSVFSNPVVRQAILAGKSADVTRPLAAKIAFEREVRMQLLEESANIRRDLKIAGRTQRLAREANLDAAQQEKILKSLESDPVMVEFAGPETGKFGERFGVKETASEGSNDIINTIIQSGDRGRKFLRTIKENKPEIAKLLEARYMTERMNNWFVRDERIPGQNWAVNKQAIVDFFSPKPGIAGDTPQAFAKEFVSPERLKELERAAKVFAEIADITKTGSLMSGRGAEELFRALGMTQSMMEGRGLTQATMQTMGARKIKDWINLGKWRAFSAMLADKPFANAIWDTDGGVLAALTKIGPGRAATLLNAHPDLAAAASDEANQR